MVIITRGSTQTIPINVSDIDFDTVEDVWVSIGQKRWRIMTEKVKKKLNLNELQIFENKIYVPLSQEDTFSLIAKLPTFIQVYFKLVNDEVVPSKMKAIYVKETINEEKM